MATRTPRTSPGPVPARRRTAVDRIHIGVRVERAHAKGIPWKQIAADEGIPERTLQDIHRKYIAQCEVTEDPSLVFEETAVMLMDALDRLYQEMEYGDTSSARVGAARALMGALRDRLNLFASVATIPGNVGAKTKYRDFSRRIEQILLELDRQEDAVPEHVRDRLIKLAVGQPHEQGEIEEVT